MELTGLKLTNIFGEPDESSSTTVTTGDLLEKQACILFLQNNYEAKIIKNRTWDIEVINDNQIFRVQVKKGGWKDCHGIKYWCCGLKKQQAGKPVPYNIKDYDYLMFDGPEGEWFIVPIHCLKLNPKTGEIPTHLSSPEKHYTHYKLIETIN